MDDQFDSRLFSLLTKLFQLPVSRCAKSDCSAAADDPLKPASFKGFLSSESIVSPVVRASNVGMNHDTNKLLAPDPYQLTNDKCDMMLDLKFQWLLKLSWILSILLILMFCTVFYLCLALGTKTSKSSRATSSSRSSKARDKRKSTRTINNPSKQVLPDQTASSWSSLTAPTSTTTTTTTNNNINQDELIKIRENNSFLAQQNHQHMMLANYLAKNGYKQQEQHQMSDFDQPQQQSLVLGRSMVSSFNDSCPNKQQQVRRRRSIGSSVAPNIAQTNKQASSSKLNQNQKSKSKSQTTIHYAQNQDPFTTIPFSYINSGYYSDGPDSQKFCQEHFAQNQGSYLNNNQLNYPIDESISLPPENGQANLASANNNSISYRQQDLVDQHGRWEKQDLSTSNQIEQQQPLNSQFDPQNSRQLINLIQHKHWQQIEQANRTAATIVPSDYNHNNFNNSLHNSNSHHHLNSRQQQGNINPNHKVWR